MSRARTSSQQRRKAQPSTADPVIGEGGQCIAEADEGEQAPFAMSRAPRLLPALPDGAFVAKPEEIDRFVVRILPDGSLYFKGSRARIDDFIAACNEVGLELHISHIALCG